MTTTSRSPSQSQSAIIWRQFQKRRLAVACAAIVVCLITISIFAPLLANDRPLFYTGVNRAEYRNSVRTYRELLSRLASSEVSEHRAEQLSSLKLQAALIQRALPDDAGREFHELHQRAIAATTTETAAETAADELQTLRREIQQRFSKNDIPLASRSYSPIFASLGGLEIGFMTWNVVLLTFPLWYLLLNRTVDHQHATWRTRIVLSLWCLLPLTVGVLWWWAVPQRNDRSNYKAAVLASDENAATSLIVFESVMWPPIAFGIDENDLANKLAKPAVLTGTKAATNTNRWSSPHWLGTDNLGRDVLTRMIWGGRVSLSVGIVAVAIYVTLGIIVGAFAGYFRGMTDLVISRVIEVVICFPSFFLILTIVALVGPSILNIMIIIGLTSWTGIARLIRGEFLRLVDQEFVLAGRALGYSPSRLIFKHILPNAVAPVIVSATFGVAGAILTESALSFLGLGISVPTPSWGSMLHDGRSALEHAPWLIWYPGMAIFVTISCYNLVGEALRDASDPRLRGSR